MSEAPTAPTAPEPRIQFDDEIKPATTNSYQVPRRDGSVGSSGLEKRKSYDPEDNQKQAAYEDLNRKKKQVRNDHYTFGTRLSRVPFDLFIFSSDY